MGTRFRNTIIVSLLTWVTLCSCQRTYTLFVGGYTENKDENGLSVYSFNPENGTLKLLSGYDAGPSPTYYCYSNNSNLIYSVNEVNEFNGHQGGGLTTLKYNKSEKTLNKLNEFSVPNGGPCYISLSPDRGFLFIANYPSGSVAVVKLDLNGFPVSVTDTIYFPKGKRDFSHAHMIMADPSGKHIYLTDLGLDRVVVYNFDSDSGKLKELPSGLLSLPDGSGPRHFAFNSAGTIMYVINELGSTISVINVDEEKGLTIVQTLSTVSDSFSGRNYCADIHLSKDGKYLYGSNRGENTIVTFRILTDGLLKLAGRTPSGGNWPRNFTIDPSGRFLLVGNQRSDTISVLRINQETGLPSGPVASSSVKQPACLKFIETGN